MPRPKFFLIDHNLTQAGGHYMEYDRRVLAAVAEHQLECVVLAGTAFSVDRELPNIEARIEPIFSADIFHLNEQFFFAPVPHTPEHLAPFAMRQFPDLPHSSWRARQAARDFHRPNFLRREVSHAIRKMRLSSVYFHTPPWSLSIPSWICRSEHAVKLTKWFWRLERWALDTRYGVLRIKGRLLKPARGFACWASGFLKAKPTRARKSNKAILGFARELVQGLERCKAHAGDVIFVPTMHFGELLAVRIAILRNPKLRLLRWRLVLRREIVENFRDVLLSRSFELLRVQTSILNWFRELTPETEVYFFTDTEALTRQYATFAPEMFQTTAIPVEANEFARQQGENAIVVSYIGDARDEKGFHLLYGIIDILTANQKWASRLCFQIQSNLASREHPGQSGFIRTLLYSSSFEQLKLIEGPFTSEQYRELIVSTDVMLMPYDLRNYRARSSGVFVEALSFGVPVVVPAGTWMHEEVEKLRQPYIQGLLLETMRGAQTLDLTIPESGREREERISVESPVTRGFDHLFLAWRLEGLETVSRGEVCFCIDFLCADGRETRSVNCLHFGAGTTLASVVPVPVNAKAVRIETDAICNYISQAPATLRPERLFLAKLGQKVPCSAIGAIYVYESEIARAILEVVDHYDHYRSTARAAAGQYAQRHSAKKLVEQMVQVD